ncbi:MAG: hypothetical protein AAF928_12465, partial [Myxococcota bacterium]
MSTGGSRVPAHEFRLLLFWLGPPTARDPSMLREAQIPFLLWLPAALLVHLLSGGSAFEVAQVENGKVELRAFTREVRDDVSASLQVVEVTFLDEEAKERPDETPPKDASSDDEEDE